MAEFAYRVMSPEGKERRGTMEGKTAEQVSNMLKGQGNVVMSVTEATVLNQSFNFSFGAKKVGARDFSIFCRQTVSILGAGVSIIEALGMMKDSTENPTLKGALAGVHEDIAKGEALTLAMRKRRNIFPEMLCNMVEAGEASGSLDIAFTRMAVQFEKDEKLRSTIKKATIYPMVLVVLMIGMMFLMLLWVIPTFMAMFEDLDTEMPAITMAIVGLSNFVQKYWLFLLAGIGCLIFGFRYFAKTPAGKKTLGGLALRLPVIGPLQTKTACARLGRTMCTLLGAGIPLVEAVEITGRSMENYYYKQSMADAKDQIMRGRTLSQPLKGSGLFPTMVTHMVTIGEETGNIEEMLENVADYYEDDVQAATDSMMALMEPAIIIVMAVVVGVMIIAILSPMMSLYEALG